MLTNRSLNSTLDRMLTLNRALDQALGANWTTNQVWVPAIDVIEKKDSYVMYVELPGVDASAVDISFEQNVLTIRGSRPMWSHDAKEGEIRVYSAERASGDFERSIHLPEFVDADNIQAEHKNGTLILTVPKARQAQARKIQLKTSEPKQVES